MPVNQALIWRQKNSSEWENRIVNGRSLAVEEDREGKKEMTERSGRLKKTNNKVTFGNSGLRESKQFSETNGLPDTSEEEKKILDIQVNDIYDNYAYLQRTHQNTAKKLLSENLQTDMVDLIIEQKRILSGFEYDAIKKVKDFKAPFQTQTLVNTNSTTSSEIQPKKEISIPEINDLDFSKLKNDLLNPPKLQSSNTFSNTTDSSSSKGVVNVINSIDTLDLIEDIPLQMKKPQKPTPKKKRKIEEKKFGILYTNRDVSLPVLREYSKGLNETLSPIKDPYAPVLQNVLGKSQNPKQQTLMNKSIGLTQNPKQQTLMNKSTGLNENPRQQTITKNGDLTATMRIENKFSSSASNLSSMRKDRDPKPSSSSSFGPKKNK